MSSPEGNGPEQKRRIPHRMRLTLSIMRTAIRLGGEEANNAMIAGFGALSEDSVIAPRLCRPNEDASALVYSQAQAGQWLGYDFRRPQFYPDVMDREDFSQHFEGVLWAMLLDRIESQPTDERTIVTAADVLDTDALMTLHKPSVELLVEMGALARRSHEQAYERAGAEQYIPDLRSRSVANDTVYQVTPKGHNLLTLRPDSGKKTPKKQSDLVRDVVPGRLAW